MYPSPCKSCEDRYFGCHSKCDKYLEFRKKCMDLNQKIRKMKAADEDFYMIVRKR